MTAQKEKSTAHQQNTYYDCVIEITKDHTGILVKFEKCMCHMNNGNICDNEQNNVGQ